MKKITTGNPIETTDNSPKVGGHSTPVVQKKVSKEEQRQNNALLLAEAGNETKKAILNNDPDAIKALAETNKLKDKLSGAGGFNGAVAFALKNGAFEAALELQKHFPCDKLSMRAATKAQNALMDRFTSASPNDLKPLVNIVRQLVNDNPTLARAIFKNHIGTLDNGLINFLIAGGGYDPDDRFNPNQCSRPILISHPEKMLELLQIMFNAGFLESSFPSSRQLLIEMIYEHDRYPEAAEIARYLLEQGVSIDEPLSSSHSYMKNPVTFRDIIKKDLPEDAERIFKAIGCNIEGN